MSPILKWFQDTTMDYKSFINTKCIPFKKTK